MIELRQWQVDAWETFKKNNHKGIIKAATGTGKTILGIKFIEELKAEMFFDGQRFLIVVPTENLLKQWAERIEIITGLNCGMIGAGHDFEEKVTVAIINSVRLRKMHYNNLILDECHHYLSDINKNILELNQFERIMGLSATPERNDLKDYSKYGLNIIYEYSTDDAINNKDLCDYKIIKTSIVLTDSERELYNKYDLSFKKYFPMFQHNINSIYEPPFSLEKMLLRTAIRKRNEVIAKSENKIRKIVDLIKQNQDKKIMVFAQFIFSMNKIKSELKKENIDCTIYGSKKDRKNAIEDFRSNKVKVMVSARALDEGVDIPDADMAIIMAGFKGERQIKQRLGRILRKKQKTAFIYLLFALDTKDEDWLRKILRFI